MATFYLPNESGWREDHNEYYWLRLKIEQSYDAGANASTLVITPQAKKNGDAMLMHVLDNTELKAGSTPLLEKVSSGGTGDTGCRFNHTGTGWTDLTQANGSVRSFTTSVAHAADGSASVVFEMHGRFVSDSSLSRSFADNAAAALSLSGSPAYTLTISAGTGAAVTVTRNGAALANGAEIRRGDVLTVGFAAARGYALTSHTLNGSAFASGGTHTVTGAVSVGASARLLGAVRLDTGGALQTYVLRLDNGEAYVPVKLFVDLGTQLKEV